MKKLALLAFVAIVAPAAANALEVKVVKEVAAAPDAVWSAVGDFCGIANWHPAIARCDMSSKGADTFRSLTLKGGGVVYEKQLTFDKAGRVYSYTIETSPLPVKDYMAQISVTPKGTGSVLSWTATFAAKDASDADAIKTIAGIFELGAAALVAKTAK